MKKAIVEMIKKGKKGFLVGAAVLLILLPVFLSCEDDEVVDDKQSTTSTKKTPQGINGLPSTIPMGVPFNLRKGITINLPKAPGKTFDDIIWASNNSGTEFATDRIVIEDDLFIPTTFFTSKVKVFAIVTDGEGEGFDYTKEFEVSIDFPRNPFIGTWSGSDGKRWTFRIDGTYGIDDDMFNTGSFVVWSGKPGRKFLVTVSGNPETITMEEVADPDNGLYTVYCFEQTGNKIKITPISFTYTDATNKQDPMQYDISGAPITLTRLSGAPATLDLSKNYSALRMIGGWTGSFTGALFNPSSDSITSTTRNITYHKDGWVQFHGPNYPSFNYSGAWLKRGAVFVTVGNDGRRWDPPAIASWEAVTATAMGGKEVVRISEKREFSRSTNTSLFWRLTKVVEP